MEKIIKDLIVDECETPPSDIEDLQKLYDMLRLDLPDGQEFEEFWKSINNFFLIRLLF